MSIKLFNDWLPLLEDQFALPFMQQIKRFLRNEKQQGKTIFPPGGQIFHALNTTSFADTKVVILGQDPYHGEGQAHGLAFSVPHGMAIPPSLRNIYQELASDLGISPPSHGCLESWAEQGVLLLNTVLTVEANKAASHANLLGKGLGWESFTSRIIELLSTKKSHVVFILWGANAQAKKSLLDTSKHCLLCAPHPSPLSAHRGFFGSKPFSAANAYLIAQGLAPINWQI